MSDAPGERSERAAQVGAALAQLERARSAVAAASAPPMPDPVLNGAVAAYYRRQAVTELTGDDADLEGVARDRAVVARAADALPRLTARAADGDLPMAERLRAADDAERWAAELRAAVVSVSEHERLVELAERDQYVTEAARWAQVGSAADVAARRAKLAAAQAAADAEAAAQTERQTAARERRLERLANGNLIPARPRSPTAGCVCCGATSDLHVDHVIAVAVGGADHPANRQTLCRRCNVSKGAGERCRLDGHGGRYLGAAGGLVTTLDDAADDAALVAA